MTNSISTASRSSKKQSVKAAIRAFTDALAEIDDAADLLTPDELLSELWDDIERRHPRLDAAINAVMNAKEDARKQRAEQLRKEGHRKWREQQQRSEQR